MLTLAIFSTFYPIPKYVSSAVSSPMSDNHQAGLLLRIETISTWGWLSVTGARFLLLPRQRIDATAGSRGG
jgi:hypothetical protein